tara:strand:- start:249 stop:497 length:249 start_codon:yes stop_codon:yes gene_type:complete
MFLALEKRLISFGYTPHNEKEFSFCLKKDKTKQVSIEETNNTYKFSFPLNDIHYTTTFLDKISLYEYVDYILNQNEFKQVSI